MLSSGKTRAVISILCIAAVGVFSRFSWNLSGFSLGHHNSTLCACRKCLPETDPWLRDLLKAAPPTFLSRNYTPSVVDLKWLQRLRSDGHNINFYKTTVDNLFKIFPSIPDVVKPGPVRCRTCAVVGNSGNLIGSHYGPRIDMHDIVIRMNHGTTKGYETDVGTKTTHHVMYPESAVSLDNTTHLVMFSFKMSDLLWLLKKFDPGDDSSVKRIANKDLVMILNPAFMRYVYEMWLGKRGSHPSTGFLTLVLSLQICDEVSVFGFGADRNGNWNHYFEILKNKNWKTGPHAGMHEYNIIQQLYQKKKIVFFKGF
ncbi:CMP-N-acetylneuraminate-beta-galactosamide-alpha-2,3-sialyltransferase 1-like [Epinephelus lanceolatus]